MALGGATLTSILSSDRLIGVHTIGEPGPIVLAMGGIHGNEPSGVSAIASVIDKLQANATPISGSFIGLRGNLPALAHRTRCIDEDLNRCFLPERIATPVRTDPSTEELQLQEITEFMDELKECHADVCFADCHSTSASTVPYISANEHPESLHLAHHFPLPCVIGLEKSIPGCFGEYCNRLDYRGFTVEGGQHDDLTSVENHKAMLWLLLAYSGAMRKKDIELFDCYEERLAQHLQGCRHFRLATHYRISDGEEFVMRPGYVNFQQVVKGEVLASNRDGEIHSPCDGRILMPLYQQQGDDGFFLLQDEE